VVAVEVKVPATQSDHTDGGRAARADGHQIPADGKRSTTHVDHTAVIIETNNQEAANLCRGRRSSKRRHIPRRQCPTPIAPRCSIRCGSAHLNVASRPAHSSNNQAGTKLTHSGVVGLHRPPVNVQHRVAVGHITNRDHASGRD